ncbi:DNA polymerase III subunit alpha [Nocardioides jishulii]|uniref:DNA polymerase III subunit alpha n=1 Tax=Nocardioides jishulii TaxID=2575440 RepID=A0A4U2YM66_9ACTN|nr:DNA polymerase III subunit alpha [Nocardioides jishulii]QCX27167.1 DNA polymerase III subunit alpha [Nocardioides jishulii]TKI61652.1 DNA polymerase III subunit alpha [Nocardioides jishulii]
MPRDPFVHLHVASGHSLQYGASHPSALVERAAEWGMDLLALTDRDGTYGAVKFAKAASRAGIRPVLGVDVAVRSSMPVRPASVRPARGRTPVRGGAYREDRWPRVTVLARDRLGWAALCRLVSDVHLGGERGVPVADVETLLPHVAGGHLVVLLGPTSEVGAAVAARRDDLAREHLSRWSRAVGRENLRVELVSHLLGATDQGWGPGSTPHAARMAGVAGESGVETVLSNAVRHARRSDAPTVDVLDAARRLVALDQRHLDRGNAEGHLKSGAQMAEVADEISRAAGWGQDGAARLLARTRALGEECALDPREDLGIGQVHFPEFEVVRRSGVATDGIGATPADVQLRARCESALAWRYGSAPRQRIWKRLHDELDVIESLGYASYFLAVNEVTDLIRDMGVRCAARGSGAGSLVNYLLGISGVDPLRHDLLMERFLSPLRSSLPDIDVDVESARRGEVYEAILQRFGGDRCVCVSMTETYRVRHAIRDVGAALGMPPGEIDAIAKAFPHVRARDARSALRDLPELRASGLAQGRLDLMFALVERLDGLPRHVAVHPCGVLLSDATLLDRTPVEASAAGYPMSQFDKDDVEDLGLLKLDVLGIRMQSAMSHAVAEIRRVDHVEVDLDDQEQVPFDDPATYELISSARTLGIFQIESPGQRELVGKSGIESFEEIITDISLFRPGPVKSDMITPYLEVKQGWKPAAYLHPDLRPILASTHGVVVFHEQVIELFATLAGVSFAEGDEKRRAMGSREGVEQVRDWFVPRALARGYEAPFVERIWEVLAAFASFGFCKAHAAAFALPTYQSAWLKTHWPAHFLSGVLTHDPGMYPKRLILDDARQYGVGVLPLDVNLSGRGYTVEPSDDPSGYAIRLALSEVRGISDAEVDRILAGRPYASLSDLWHRAPVSRPVAERLVLTGAFDGVHRIATSAGGVGVREQVTRRDLLLQVAELERVDRSDRRAARGRRSGGRIAVGGGDVRERAAAQVRGDQAPAPVESVQLALAIDGGGDTPVSGLPELSVGERTAAELEILGLDVSSHVVTEYAEFLDALQVVRSRDLLRCRSKAEVLVAGVKVATQTPPIRSGRRVVFLTLDDSTGPVDATFFEDAQGPYAATVFSTWLLLVRGEVRRTGPRGVSLRATGAWSLPELYAVWRDEPTSEAGLAAVRARLAAPAVEPSVDHHDSEQRRVLVHSSGFRMSPYADVKPAGGDGLPARALWHRSPGSPG